MSKRTEHRWVGRALAGACIERGVETLTCDPRPLHFAFERAWREWPHASRFPQIRSDAGWSSIERVFTAAADADDALAAWTSHPHGYAPYLEPGSCVPALAQKLERDIGLPWDQWQALADVFLAALGNHGTAPPL